MKPLRPLNDDDVKTLGSAVFVARALNVFLRDSRTTVANSFKLSDWLKMGWIGLTEDGGFRATPALSVLELYATGLAGELIDVELEGPVFSSAPTGFIDAVQDAPAIAASGPSQAAVRRTQRCLLSDQGRAAQEAGPQPTPSGRLSQPSARGTTAARTTAL